MSTEKDSMGRQSYVMNISLQGRFRLAVGPWISVGESTIEQWYPTFFVRVTPDVISLQLFTPNVVVV
jgi:hypothetical protein